MILKAVEAVFSSTAYSFLRGEWSGVLVFGTSNKTSQQTPVTSHISRAKYTTLGELMKVTLPDGKVIEYINDPLGRRIAKKINGILVEKYLWQGLTRLLAIYDANDNILIRFEYADSRLPFAMQSGGNTYYLAYDQVVFFENCNRCLRECNQNP